MTTGMASGHKTRGKSNEWLTPQWLFAHLGRFHLDPCASDPRPWDIADTHWTKADDGLSRPWFGRVWLNPPYGPPSTVRPWLDRMVDHGRGTTLIFARTETALFQDTVLRHASALLFIRGRLRFWRKTGMIGEGKNAGAPSVLCAFGPSDALYLRRSRIPGKYLALT